MSNDGITLTADTYTVSVRETRSLGDYENIEPYAEVSGSIPNHGELGEESRRELKARLLALQKELQAVVERAADNRVAEREDWGVHNGGDSE